MTWSFQRSDPLLVFGFGRLPNRPNLSNGRADFSVALAARTRSATFSSDRLSWCFVLASRSSKKVTANVLAPPANPSRRLALDVEGTREVTSRTHRRKDRRHDRRAAAAPDHLWSAARGGCGLADLGAASAWRI